ncbi:MAG: homoserine kinase [Anaerolineae bacterium]|nr:MAG: homoserine kinase [Anaerolineae bacterium]
MNPFRVHVPATSANLGPGFDTLGLALNLWNETTFETGAARFRLDIEGEGAQSLPTDKTNAIYAAFATTYAAAKQTPPAGVHIHCLNRIPLGAGLGSSAAAALTGILAANHLLNEVFDRGQVIALATELEGHPDNVAPAMLGGLTISAAGRNGPLTRRAASPDLSLVVVIPDFRLATKKARRALPDSYSRADAVASVGRAALVVEALRANDRALLAEAMADSLHQPYRLPLIPGAAQALAAAQALGAAAALSGAGPGVIAFPPADPQPVARAMQAAFTAAGKASRALFLHTSADGARVKPAE